MDLALVPEVDARKALAGRSLHLRVLAPVGGWLGVGRLRVLRTAEIDDRIELVCGYESFDRLRTGSGQARD